MYDLSILMHAANVLYLISYSVRDILWLRIITVLAILLLIPYLYTQCDDIGPVVWNALFIAINVVRIQMLLAERRPPRLSDREKRLHQLAFSRLDPREMLNLLAVGEWKTYASQDVLAAENVELDHLILVYEGRARVLAKGREVAEIRPGDFVGEMSFLTEGRTSAQVLAKGQVEAVVWSRDAFQKFLDNNQNLRSAMLSVIGLDLVHKLVELRQRLKGDQDASTASAGVL